MKPNFKEVALYLEWIKNSMKRIPSDHLLEQDTTLKSELAETRTAE